MVKRVIATEEATKIITRLKDENGELVFMLSGGCCDGTTPMCYEKGDFYVPSSAVKLGELCGDEFYIDEDRFEYFHHSQIIVDIKKEQTPGNSFSLEIDLGYQFIARSRIFSDEEIRELEDKSL